MLLLRIEGMFDGKYFWVMEIVPGLADILAKLSFNILNSSVICECCALIALALEDQYVSE